MAHTNNTKEEKRKKENRTDERKNETWDSKSESPAERTATAPQGHRHSRKRRYSYSCI